MNGVKGMVGNGERCFCFFGNWFFDGFEWSFGKFCGFNFVICIGNKPIR